MAKIIREGSKMKFDYQKENGERRTVEGTVDKIRVIKDKGTMFVLNTPNGYRSCYQTRITNLEVN